MFCQSCRSAGYEPSWLRRLYEGNGSHAEVQYPTDTETGWLYGRWSHCFWTAVLLFGYEHIHPEDNWSNYYIIYHPSPSLRKLNAWYIDSGVFIGVSGEYDDLWTKVFRQAFAKYDLDGNGKLAREELPPLLENLHISMRILVSKFLVATGVTFRFFDWKRFVEQRIKVREIKGWRYFLSKT